MLLRPLKQARSSGFLFYSPTALYFLTITSLLDSNDVIQAKWAFVVSVKSRNDNNNDDDNNNNEVIITTTIYLY